MEFKCLLFSSSIDLFGVKDFKNILIRKCVSKEFDVAVFMVRGISLGKSFWGGEHLTSSSTKTAQAINFKLRKHISNRLLHKIVSGFFLIISYLFFYCNYSKSNNSYRNSLYFPWKHLLCKKYLKRRKSRARYFLSLGWLHIKLLW